MMLSNPVYEEFTIYPKIVYAFESIFVVYADH
jgi:hypothetical protein